jgi:hypothetical protein
MDPVAPVIATISRCVIPEPASPFFTAVMTSLLLSSSEKDGFQAAADCGDEHAQRNGPREYLIGLDEVRRLAQAISYTARGTECFRNQLYAPSATERELCTGEAHRHFGGAVK